MKDAHAYNRLVGQKPFPVSRIRKYPEGQTKIKEKLVR